MPVARPRQRRNKSAGHSLECRGRGSLFFSVLARRGEKLAVKNASILEMGLLRFLEFRRARPSERAHARTSRDRQSAALVVLALLGVGNKTQETVETRKTSAPRGARAMGGGGGAFFFGFAFF